MANKDAPCKNCDDRYCGCHIECEDYISYSNERKIENERRCEAIERERGIYEHFRKNKRGENVSKILKSPKR